MGYWNIANTSEHHLNYDTLDDVTLISLITRSDNEAMRVLYDRYSRLVFSLSLNIVGDQAVAEEITQDVFTSVWEKAMTYRAEQSRVSTWLSSITRYRSIDILRRKGSRPEQHSISWSDLHTDVIANPETTSEMAELSIMRKRVRAALAELPVEQRDALALAYLKGYSHSEIALELGEPLGTIKTRIRLAMQKLRIILEPEEQNGNL